MVLAMDKVYRDRIMSMSNEATLETLCDILEPAASHSKDDKLARLAKLYDSSSPGAAAPQARRGRPIYETPGAGGGSDPMYVSMITMIFVG
jgi:hypothetical protein